MHFKQRKAYFYGLCLAIVLGVFFIGYGFYAHAHQGIPKIIHYVWLGGKPLPESAQQAIQTWQKFAPDYQIMRWDENSYNIDETPFLRDSYNNKDYAYAANYIRFKVLHDYGGIYLDTDMFLTGDLSLLDAYDLALSFESNKALATSFIAAAPHHPLMKKVYETYAHRSTGKRAETSPELLTALVVDSYPSFKMNGRFQTINNDAFFPANFFILNLEGPENRSYHIFDASWRTEKNSDTYYTYRGFIVRFLIEQTLQIIEGGGQTALVPIQNDIWYFLDTKELVKVLEKTDHRLVLSDADGRKSIYIRDKDMPLNAYKKEK